MDTWPETTTETKSFATTPTTPAKWSHSFPTSPAPVFEEKVEHTDDTWLYCFADNAYAPNVPPVIPGADYPEDGLVHELLFQASTGNDDMRGGGDNVGIVVSMTDGSSYNLRDDQRRPAHGGATLHPDRALHLPTPLPFNGTSPEITLRDTFGGGVQGRHLRT